MAWVVKSPEGYYLNAAGLRALWKRGQRNATRYETRDGARAVQRSLGGRVVRLKPRPCLLCQPVRRRG